MLCVIPRLSCCADCATALLYIELSKYNKVSLSLVQVPPLVVSDIRDDPYWISRKNSLELIELSSKNKVSLVLASSCSNTG